MPPSKDMAAVPAKPYPSISFPVIPAVCAAGPPLNPAELHPGPNDAASVVISEPV